MRLVAGVNALGAVACKKVDVVDQARVLFEHGYANLFSCAWVNGGLIYNNVALFKHFAYGGAGFDKRRQVRAVVLVNGGGHSNNKNCAITQGGGVGGKAQVHCLLKFFGLNFKGMVLACL